MDRFDGIPGIPGDRMPGRDGLRAFLTGLLGLDWLPGVDSLLGGIALTLVGIAGLVLLFRLLSMAWAVVRLHGFRLTLTGEDLRTEFGLLTRVVATIPLRRIQTLTIHQGPLHRLLGRASVRVDTAGAGGGGEDDESGKTQREWLAPIVRREELPRLVGEVLPGMDLASVKWQAAPPRAFRRELKGWLIGFVIPLPFLLLWKGWALFLLPLLLAWAWFGARGTVANLGWAVTGSAVLFRSGWIWRRVSVAPFAKIQAVEVHETPFDRRAAMASVKVDTAGAKEGSHGVDIPYLPRDTAAVLGDLLAAQAARTAFRW
ncbi:MAG TPA: PH domain-containing protein, partial [Thermoanaerobaculia bacterium]|nr:PH domain-containing protein [Thermoanaerobaculia bacterium]